MGFYKLMLTEKPIYEGILYKKNIFNGELKE